MLPGGESARAFGWFGAELRESAIFRGPESTPPATRAFSFWIGECEAARMADVTIDIITNGPYIVKGEVEMKDADGNTYPVEKRMALCRCGASTEKPFCDGTHSKIGFQAAEKAVPESAEG